MAITVNSNPKQVNPGKYPYKDTAQYFNHVQFNGLCDNKNVDTIDPNTFQNVENLYIDSNDTLSSRPKLKEHDKFGFTSIEKMWIWDDIHLILGTYNSINTLLDYKNSVSLPLNSDFKNLTRVENRIYIFLENKVFVYEKNIDYSFIEITDSNIGDYFYIPSTTVIIDNLPTTGEANNELVSLQYKTILSSNNSVFNKELQEGDTVIFTMNGVEYKVTNWVPDISNLTLAAPALSGRIFNNYYVADNMTILAYLGATDPYYTTDGKTWTALPIPPGSNSFFRSGISKNGKFAYSYKATNKTNNGDGVYIISLAATEYPDGPTLPAKKKYENWTLITPNVSKMVDLIAVNETTPNTTSYGCMGVSIDMLDWDKYVIAYADDQGYMDVTGHDCNYHLIISDGSSNGVKREATISQNLYDEGNAFQLNPIMGVKVYATYETFNGNTLFYMYYGTFNRASPSSPTAYNCFSIFYRNGSSITAPGGNPFVVNAGGKNIPLMYDGGLGYTRAYPYITIESRKSLLVRNGSSLDFYFPILFGSLLLRYKHSVTIGSSLTVGDIGQADWYNISPTITSNPGDSTASIIMKDPNTFLSRFSLIKISNVTNHLMQGTSYTTTIPITARASGYPIFFVAQAGSTPYLSSFQYDKSVLYFDNNKTAFYVDGVPFFNPLPQTVSAKVLENGGTGWTGIYPSLIAETNNTQYWVDGKEKNHKTLYIENRKWDKDWKPLLYFPTNQTDVRPNEITNLLVIDRGVVALFNEYEIWYVTKVTLDETSGSSAYAYYKSRVGLGCKYGADVDILYDGATITYATPRGLVGMNYQQLTQNTDQVLTYLSDNITSKYDGWYEDGKIKIFKYKFWTVFFKVGSFDCLVLDLRNGSWWVWKSNIKGYGLKEIYMYDDKPLLLCTNGDLLQFDYNHETPYKDLNTQLIEWKCTSQPLAFGAINNYKRITSINVNTIQVTKEPFNYVLIVKNYKNLPYLYGPKVVEFDQEKIPVNNYRTFVKRLNYIQSVKFQYTLANDSSKEIQTPINITAISTKYEIKGRVR